MEILGVLEKEKFFYDFKGTPGHPKLVEDAKVVLAHVPENQKSRVIDDITIFLEKSTT